MQISKHQKLFLHNVLFHYLAQNDVNSAVRSGVEDIMDLLQDDLVHRDTQVDEDEVSEEEESGYVENPLSLYTIKNLPPLRVTTQDGDRNTLAFFVSEGTLCFDLDSKGVLVETLYDVCRITRGGTTLKLETNDGDEIDLDVSKFPVEWTSCLKVNTAYSVV